MKRRHRLPAIVAVVLTLGCATPVYATSLDFSKVTIEISGAGAILSSYGFSGFTVGTTGSYRFAIAIVNITGTPPSTSLSSSFFDVFIELEVDGSTSPCSNGAVIGAGGTQSCELDLFLTAGAHTITTYASLTFPDPFTRIDNSLFP